MPRCAPWFSPRGRPEPPLPDQALPSGTVRSVLGWPDPMFLGCGAMKPKTSCDTVHVAAASAPPPGFHSVTPRMVVDDPVAAVEFLRAVFDATGETAPNRPAEVRIGDSLVMVSATGDRAAFPAFLYVYVDDVDTTCRRALQAGAVVVEAPLDTPYGDRRATVRDSYGNVYQIARRTGRTTA
jgi:PhnB protein